MSLLSSYPKAKKANKNLYCYKIFCTNDKPENKKEYVSPFTFNKSFINDKNYMFGNFVHKEFLKNWLKNKEGYSCIDENLSTGEKKYIVDEGFIHAFIDIDSAKSFLNYFLENIEDLKNLKTKISFNKLILVKCLIPKEVYYYENSSNICAEKIKVDKIIDIKNI